MHRKIFMEKADIAVRICSFISFQQFAFVIKIRAKPDMIIFNILVWIE